MWLWEITQELSHGALRNPGEPVRQKLIYYENGSIGPYSPDFSANGATMHLAIEKIWPRFLPRRFLDRVTLKDISRQSLVRPEDTIAPEHAI